MELVKRQVQNKEHFLALHSNSGGKPLEDIVGANFFFNLGLREVQMGKGEKCMKVS